MKKINKALFLTNTLTFATIGATVTGAVAPVLATSNLSLKNLDYSRKANNLSVSQQFYDYCNQEDANGTKLYTNLQQAYVDSFTKGQTYGYQNIASSDFSEKVWAGPIPVYYHKETWTCEPTPTRYVQLKPSSSDGAVVYNKFDAKLSQNLTAFNWDTGIGPDKWNGWDVEKQFPSSMTLETMKDNYNGAAWGHKFYDNSSFSADVVPTGNKFSSYVGSKLTSNFPEINNIKAFAFFTTVLSTTDFKFFNGNVKFQRNSGNDYDFKYLVTDPSLYTQISGLSKDENGNFITHVGLNEELINAALSVRYYNDIMQAVDANGKPMFEGSGEQKHPVRLYNRDIGDVPNPDDHVTDYGLHLDKTYYYGQVLGMQDLELGCDKWIPISDGTPEHPGLSPVKYPGGYFGSDYKAIQKDLNDFVSNKITEHPEDQEFLSYANYFAFRSAVKQWVIDNEAAPTAIQLEEILSNCKTTNWFTACEKYGIDSNDAGIIDNLSTILPALHYNDWLMYDKDGSTSNSWSNDLQSEYTFVAAGQDDQGANYGTFSNLVNGEVNATIPVNSIPSSSDHYNIIRNTHLMVNNTSGDYDPNGKIRLPQISTAQNLEGGDYNQGDTAGVEYYNQMSNGAVKNIEVSYRTHPTQGIQIAKQGKLLRKITDADIKDKLNIVVKNEADAPSFYDTTKENPDFNKGSYELNKYNPLNQPHLLKPVSDILNSLSGTEAEKLRQIFYNVDPSSNNKEPALPFVQTDLYDIENLNFTGFDDRLGISFDDTTGTLCVQLFKAGETHDSQNIVDDYRLNGVFGKTEHPYVPPTPGTDPKTTAIIVGSVLAGVFVIGVGSTLIYTKRRKAKSLHPQVKKNRRIGDFEI